MGSNFNFKNFNDPSSDAGGGRPPGNLSSLTRQTSIYSLTLDEFQTTMMGGIGKDFGSLNMDELLKNIWSAEEIQNLSAAASSAVAAGPGPGAVGIHEGAGIQRQGSFTLPRTLSQKTVDEVWKDMSKEYGGPGGGSGGSGGAGGNLQERQQTLGEMTLEEFLVRAGVVREDAQLAAATTGPGGGGGIGKVNAVSNGGGFFGNNGSSGLGIGFQQNRGIGGSSNNTTTTTANSNNNQISNLQSSNMPLNGNGVRTNPTQAQAQHQHQQQIFPKQPNVGYIPQMPLQSSPGIRGGIMGIGDQGINGGLMQSGAMGMVGLGAVATGSPANHLSSDGIGKCNGDTSSVSPVPYVFNGGLRGRRACNAVEKVVERRQRRMIKNRESAARSRARKQAYTMELEAEVAKLKEENQELQRKQEKMMEKQKNEAIEMMNMQQGLKKPCLRRTQTGPW